MKNKKLMWCAQRVVEECRMYELQDYTMAISYGIYVNYHYHFTEAFDNIEFDNYIINQLNLELCNEN